jgi:hypothetical protein
VFQGFRGHTGRTLGALCWVVGSVGLLVIIGYSWGSSGSHLRYACVSVVVAFAALGSGAFFGFLFGIPRYVSSGQLRLTQTQAVAKALPANGHDQAAGAQGAQGAQGAHGIAAVEPPPAAPVAAPSAPAFAPSTNLAEVSDWLTKLLLGAGLVSITRLGKPIGSLIHNVADGIGPSGTTSGAPDVMAGGILVTYLVLGFLVGYVTTTLWYGNKLGRVNSGQQNS